MRNRALRWSHPGVTAADNEIGWRMAMAKLAALVEGKSLPE